MPQIARAATAIVRLDYFRVQEYWAFNVISSVLTAHKKVEETVMLRSYRYNTEKECLADCALTKGGRDIPIQRIGG
jgi:hypothetical protein